MNLQPLLQTSVSGLETCVQALSVEFEAPVLDRRVGFPAFRHRTKDDLLASFLKGVRIASALNAALVLLRTGYVQEVYVLCRLIDEAGEDIAFLSSPLGDNGPSADQVRFVNEFFQEQFSDPKDPLGSLQKRDRVSRRRIHAALSGLDGAGSSPSRIEGIARSLHQMFSGFVHGAYGHIMDLYGGRPPTYHTNGMLGTSRIAECERQLVNYVYRALLAIETLAMRTNRVDVANQLTELSIDLARRTGCLSEEGIEAAVKRLSRQRAIDANRSEP